MSIAELVEERVEQNISDTVREATFGLISSLKTEFNGKAGFTFILGYGPEHKPYVSNLKKDRVEGRRINVTDESAYDFLAKMAREDDDGAVLISKEGYLVKTGMRLRPDPEDVLDELKIPNSRTLGERFGFAHDVGTRHTSAIAATHRMKDIEAYVLSQETGHIRVFSDVNIVFSTEPRDYVKNSGQTYAHNVA